MKALEGQVAVVAGATRGAGRGIARMLGEAGMLLAEEPPVTGAAGCLTPAIALGTASAPRFADARVRFSVDP